MKYDVFISHASEDTLEVAIPLAQELQKAGLRVWLDEFELTIGDNLTESINRGLTQSRFGIVILSPSFFSKWWPRRELGALLAIERQVSSDGRKVLLPIWHKLSEKQIVESAPLLADRLAVSTVQGIEQVAEEVIQAVLRDRQTESDKSIPDESPVQYLEHRVANEVAEIRKQVLTASSLRELKLALYQTEALLARFPNRAEIRLLKDEIEEAIKAEARTELRVIFLDGDISPRRIKRLFILIFFLFYYFMAAHRKAALALGLAGGITIGGSFSLHYALSRRSVTQPTADSVVTQQSIRQLSAEEAFSIVQESFEDRSSSFPPKQFCSGLRMPNGVRLVTCDYGLKTIENPASGVTINDQPATAYQPLALIYLDTEFGLGDMKFPKGSYVVWNTKEFDKDTLEIEGVPFRAEHIHKFFSLSRPIPKGPVQQPRVSLLPDEGKVFLVVGENRLPIEIR